MFFVVVEFHLIHKAFMAYNIKYGHHDGEGKNPQFY